MSHLSVRLSRATHLTWHILKACLHSFCKKHVRASSKKDKYIPVGGLWQAPVTAAGLLGWPQALPIDEVEDDFHVFSSQFLDLHSIAFAL